MRLSAIQYIQIVSDHLAEGEIASKIKHTIKLKTSPARLAQLLQPSLAFCFNLQPMTAHRPVRRHWLQAKTKWGLQQLCKSCRTCFKFYCMFYFTWDRSFMVALPQHSAGGRSLPALLCQPYPTNAKNDCSNHQHIEVECMRNAEITDYVTGPSLHGPPRANVQSNLPYSPTLMT